MVFANPPSGSARAVLLRPEDSVQKPGKYFGRNVTKKRLIGPDGSPYHRARITALIDRKFALVAANESSAES
jgi:hypothetical protein